MEEIISEVGKCPKCKIINSKLGDPAWAFTRNPIIKIDCECMECGTLYELVISLTYATILEENIK